jgi:hypothetical protein
LRTKAVEGVLRVELTATDPRAELYLVYDGLGGLSQRPFLRDLCGELQVQGPKMFASFLEAMRRRGGGKVYVYFADYVSYGIGGGDATAEFFFKSFLILRSAAVPKTEKRPGSPEELRLIRTEGTERVIVEEALGL